MTPFEPDPEMDALEREYDLGLPGSIFGPSLVEPGENPNRKPAVKCNNRQLPELVDEFLHNLNAWNSPKRLFTWGDSLAHLTENETGRPIIQPVTEPYLRALLGQSSNCYITTPAPKKPGKNGGENGNGEEFRDKAISPPLDAVREIRSLPRSDLLERGGLGFSPLDGLTEIPLLRPDGTIVEKQGYDAITRLYYKPAANLNVPPIPAEPDGEDRNAAVAAVNEVLWDFSFEGEADRANAFALLLTAVVRPALGHGYVPLMCVDAPSQGSGKGLLIDGFSIALTGRQAPVRQAPPYRDEAEWRKSITSALLDGSPLAVFDNQETEIGAAALASVLTSHTWTDRRLGSAQQVSLRNNVTWLVNGNNLRFSGDIVRRCVWIRLDTRAARPWTRSGPAEGRPWRHANLPKYVSENRGEIIRALLVMARSWYAAGSPKPPDLKPMGSFEAWNEIVGGILYHCGIPGFLANREASYEILDERMPQWIAFLEALYDFFGSKRWTVSEVYKKLREDGPAGALHNVLPDGFTHGPKGELISSRGFGKALAKSKGTVFGELVLQRDDSKKSMAQWYVGRVSEPSADQ